MQNPGQQINEDGAPNLMINAQVPSASFPAAVQPNQLVGAVVVSRTSHSQPRRQGLIAVVSGAQPPAMRPRTSEDLLANFAEMQAQDADYKSIFYFVVAEFLI